MEVHGKKQIEAIKDNKKQLDNINSNYQKKLLLSKEREIFQNIYNENLDKIEQLTNKTNYDYLKYVSESSGTETVFYAKKNIT